MHNQMWTKSIERIKHRSCTTFFNPTKTCKMYQKRLINGFWLHYQFCHFIYQQEIFLLSFCSSQWDPLMGVTYVPSLRNFKTCYLVYWGGSHVAVGVLLLYWSFLCCCHSFNLTSCRLSPFLLSYVTAPRPCMSLVRILPQQGFVNWSFSIINNYYHFALAFHSINHIIIHD